jgi:hypothetical protein
MRSNAATLRARETPGWLRSDIVTRRPWTQNRKSSNITCLFEMSVLSSIISPRTRDVRACSLIHSCKTAAICMMISVAAMWLTCFLPTFQTQLAAPWYLASCSLYGKKIGPTSPGVARDSFSLLFIYLFHLFYEFDSLIQFNSMSLLTSLKDARTRRLTARSRGLVAELPPKLGPFFNGRTELCAVNWGRLRSLRACPNRVCPQWPQSASVFP